MSDAAAETTHFSFEHKAFAIPGCYFAKDRMNGEPAFFVPYGEVFAAVALPALRKNFSIEEDTVDGRLLNIVPDGLKYVKAIRPGDQIPNEILNGTASWTIDDRHFALSRQRLTVQLASWISGDETLLTDPDLLAQVAGDPKTVDRYRQAIDRLVEEPGLNLAIVKDRIEKLIQEFGYIEALRERVGTIFRLPRTLATLIKHYRYDRSLVESMRRVGTLLRQPIETYQEMFFDLDGNTAEARMMVINFDRMLAYVRERRDELRGILLVWDEELEFVDAFHEIPEEKETKTTTDRLLRFLARKFAPTMSWGVSSGPRRAG